MKFIKGFWSNTPEPAPRSETPAAPSKSLSKGTRMYDQYPDPSHPVKTTRFGPTSSSAAMADEISNSRKEIHRLRTALAFYADRSNWTQTLDSYRSHDVFVPNRLRAFEYAQNSLDGCHCIPGFNEECPIHSLRDGAA